MKQKLKRFMAGFMAMLTLVGTLFTNGTTAFAASPQANIAFWNASVKNSGEVSELKPGYNHGKILYSILDGNSAYCMNFGLRADGGQLMNSYDDASTSMSAQQRKLLSYCLYYGFNSTQKAAPSNSQCDEYIATQAMVWVIVADIFGTGSGDSAARKLCNTAPSPDSSYSYYERLRDNISSSYNATLPSFASRRTSEAPTYELKWNEGSQRFETTLSDSNGVLSDFDFGISGYSVDKNGNSITISSTSVNTTATTGTFTSNAGKVETTSSCVFWLTGKSGYQEFISERPTADPIKAYIKVKTENIGYGELTKTDESSGVKLSGAVYGIYSDSGCTNRVQTMTTDGNGYAKSAALVAGTYYVKEITAPKGYVLSGKVHTLTVKAGQTTGISATDKEQLGAITIYKEGEVLSSWNGSNFTYEKKKLSGATFKVTAGADIYKADGTKVYSAGDVVAESLTTGTDGQVVLSDLHLGTYVVTEIKSIDGYTINTTPQTVAVEYKDQTVTVQYESTTIENTRQKADVSVVKKDSDTENPLDGGKYTLYAGNDIKNYAGQVIVTKGTALETVTTGEDGKASYSVDLPISNGYYIQETQAPYAYIRNSKDVYSFNFNVLPETQAKASFSHTFVNDRTTAKIHIYKVDKESGKAVAQGDASLEGAVYGLYARNDIVHPDGATGVVFKAGDLVATLTTDKNGEAEVNNLYLGNYYVKEITPSEGYLLDEEEHDVVCDYEGDLVAEVSRSTTSAEQVIKQPFQLIKVSDNGDDTEAGLLAGAEFTAYLKSSLSVKADGSYDFDKATPVVIGENGATTITSDEKGHAVSIAIPYGTYVVVESKTPHNMKTIKPFEVKIKENHPTEPQTWRVFLDREFTAKLRVIKKDSDTKQTVLVPNAEFKMSATLILISLPRSQDMTKTLVQNYMMSSVKSNGYIIDTLMAVNGKNILQSPDTMSKILSGVKIEGNESSYAYLVSADGTMLYHPDSDKIGKPVENEVITKLVNELKSGKISDPDCAEYRYDGVVKYASYYVNPEGRFILVITNDEADAFAPITKMKNVMVAGSVVVLIILVCAGCIVIRNLVKPLHVLTGVVDKIAELDFTKDAREEKLASRKDEIGLISKSINNLHSELTDIISIIQKQGEKLSDSNEKFTKGFSEIVESVDNINVAVEEIATGSTAQAQDTSAASDNVANIGNAIEANGLSVSTLENSITRMDGLAAESEEMLVSLVEMNNKTSDTIGVVTEQTDRTNESAQNISNAVTVIQDIAAQTNLLSLNASIEAARAGESGRGFAVVAEQIRKLAEDSAESATEIENIVRELMGNSKDSVEKMQELSRDSSVQADKLNRTKESFYELKKEINEVSSASKEIFDQTVVIEELKKGVNDVIEQLASVAQENAASTEETSASMQSLANNVDLCKEESAILNDLSKNINEQTSRFKF